MAGGMYAVPPGEREAVFGGAVWRECRLCEVDEKHLLDAGAYESADCLVEFGVCLPCFNEQWENERGADA